MNRKPLFALYTIFALTFCVVIPNGVLASPKADGILTTNGYVFYPARLVAEKFGASMQLNQSTGAITINGSKNKIVFTPNQKQLLIGTAVDELEVAPFVRNGITYLPAKILIDGLELRYSFNESDKTNTLWIEKSGHTVKVTLKIVKDPEKYYNEVGGQWVETAPPSAVDREPFIVFKKARERVMYALNKNGYANPPWTGEENMNLQDIIVGMLDVETYVRHISVGVKDHNANRYSSDLNCMATVINMRLPNTRLSDSERLQPVNRLYLQAVTNLQDAVKQFGRFNEYKQQPMYNRGVVSFGTGAVDLLEIPVALEKAKNRYP